MSALFFLFYRKTITINIFEEDSYEKDVKFYIELGEPKLLKGNTISTVFWVWLL